MDAEPAAEPLKKRSRKRLWFYVFFAVPVIGLLAAIAIPNFVKARTTECKNACINNLRQIDGAKEQWALEDKKSARTAVGADEEKQVNKFIKGDARPKCPDGGTYTYGNIDAPPMCSFPGHSL